jgi:hypothetical protein
MKINSVRTSSFNIFTKQTKKNHKQTHECYQLKEIPYKPLNSFLQIPERVASFTAGHIIHAKLRTTSNFYDASKLLPWGN